MDLLVELPALASNGWFDEISTRLGNDPLLANITVTELKPPVGGMGADVVPRLKVAFNTTRDVASLVAAVVAIAAAVHGGPAPTKTCTLRMTNGPQSIVMTVPCDRAPGKEFVDEVTKLIAVSPDGQMTVRVMPSVKP